MNWQELIVAVIVGLAVVSLYRHLRAEMGGAKPGAQPSCHGCDQFADDAESTAPTATDPAALHPRSTRPLVTKRSSGQASSV